jgi:Lon protease-like protein
VTGGQHLPGVIPIFPLPNVVHFPGVPLPLHIFEPRYRDMVRDALAGDGLIGMVLLRAGWEPEYQGRPAVFETGTAGRIIHNERFGDGRFNIVLRGEREFRVRRELDDATYRRAVVEWRSAPTDGLSAELRDRVWTLVRDHLRDLGREEALPASPRSGASDEALLGFLAQHLDLSPLERLGMLESETLTARAERLVASLEFQREALRAPGGPGQMRPH